MIIRKDKEMKILIINGPNLNMLGRREPEIYGSTTLSDIQAEILEYSKKYDDAEIEFFQSNSEGQIVDKIQACLDNFDGIIINPAAYTHTSVAIRDAIRAVNLPAVEVHLSNINDREEFRKVSYTAPACIGQITGFGKDGYKAALFCLISHIKCNNC